MAKRKLDDLVSCFVFKEAKEKLDAFQMPDSIKKEVEVSPQYHDNSTIVAPQYHHDITKVSSQDHDSITTVSPRKQYHDSIMAVSVSVSGHHQKEESQKVELTDIQMQIYNWFLGRGMEGHYNKWGISKDTGFIHCTIRKVMKKLEASELILVTGYNRSTKLFSYRINNKKTAYCGSPQYQYQYQVTTVSVSPQGHDANSSSSYIYKTTTTARESFLDHPEMCFWEKQGVTSDMIQKNIEHHNIDPELFIQSMKYYAFEFSQPGSRQPEKTHLAHLIGGIRQFGMWAKPNGYVSHEDAEKKRLRAFIAEKRKELEELEALKLEASFFMFYEAYVKTPDSEEVRAVMEQASSFDLDNLRKKPDKKEAWLRTIWNKSRNMN